jgi:hypothetical protein
MLNCPCKYVSNSAYITCPCGDFQHFSCVGHLKNQMAFYECPSCQIRKSDPFLISHGYLISPTFFQAKDIKRGIEFTINEECVKFLNQDDGISRVLMIRCIRQTPPFYEIHFPKNVTILINKKPIKKFITPLNILLSKERRDQPIVLYTNQSVKTNNFHNFKELYHMINLELKVKNSFEIINENLEKNDNTLFVWCIEKIEIIKNVDELIKTIPLTPDFTKMCLNGIIKDKLIQKIKIPLIDPYNKERIQIPVRSFNCLHFNVFDLKTFLALRRNKLYNCPYCNKKAINLYVDQKLKTLLDTNKMITQCDILNGEIVDENTKLEPQEGELIGEIFEDINRFEIPAPENEIIDLTNDDDHYMNYPTSNIINTNPQLIIKTQPKSGFCLEDISKPKTCNL